MKPAAMLLAAVVALTAAPVAAAFSSRDWRQQREVRLPSLNPKSYYYLRLDQEVFRYARPDLSDVRLVNDRGLEVPYVLEVRKGESRWERYLPRAWSEGPDTILDLGRTGLPHNQLLLTTDATNFRGRVAVLASDDLIQWTALAHDLAVFDHTAEVHASNLRLDYPASTCRYLKLVFTLDRGAITNPGAEVMMVNTIATEYQDLASIEHECSQEPGTNDTVCKLKLRNLPVSRLTLSVADDGFFRAARLLDRNGVEIAQTCLYRYQDRELVRENLGLKLPETQAEEFTLRIRNFDDQPLALSSVRAETTARDLVFRAGPAERLHLFLGNRGARAPVYDLNLLMNRVKPEPRPVWAEMGPVKSNPAFASPAPKPQAARPKAEYDDLMWPGLIFTGVVLAALILISVRQLRHEEDTKPPGDGLN